MSQFIPNRGYQPDLDIRFADGHVPSWATPLVEGVAPVAPCWLVTMPRRAGKTWLTAAITQARAAGSTHRIDLRASGAAKKAGLLCLINGKTNPQWRDGLIVVDEPGVAPAGARGNDPRKLADGLNRLRDANMTAIVFATPHECAMLLPHLGVDGPKGVRMVPDLTEPEIRRMADRAAAWAPELVERVKAKEPSWLRVPFVLELLLHVAEDHPRLVTDLAALFRATVDEAEARHQYTAQLVHNGLSVQQRAEIRAGRWREAGIDTTHPNTVGPWIPRSVADDPVLARHLPMVLRIHHISDLHHGGHLRTNVDTKDQTETGRRLARLAGAGSPLDGYLSHVEQLGTQHQAPHLVIVTGDIVDRPGTGNGEQAVEWLDRLRKLLCDHPELADDEPRIVLVGGNHDVSWDLCLDSDPQARHQWFHETFGRYPHPDLQVPAGSGRRLVVRYPGAGLRLVLLGSAESGGEAVADEDRRTLERARAELLAADSVDLHDLIGRFERVDPGVVSRRMLDALSREQGSVTLAALHHPVSPVPSVEIAPYAGIVNAGQVKRALVTAETALVLHGHTHLGFMAAERIIGVNSDWTLRIAGAATLAAESTYEHNGYNQIYIGREGAGSSIVMRPVTFDGGQWMAQNHIAFYPGRSSECTLADLLNDPRA